MTVLPSSAYELLELIERQHVDEYVSHAISEQRRKRERIELALKTPIPSEFVKRSKGRLNHPLVQAAIVEKIKKAAYDEDISPERVINEHAAIAFSNISDFIQTLDFGQFQIKDLKEIPSDKIGAVKTIKSVPGPYGTRTEIVMHDKHPSLKVMTELMGLVAPDTPPALGKYTAPIDDVDKIEEAPADLYEQYLEGECVT